MMVLGSLRAVPGSLWTRYGAETAAVSGDHVGVYVRRATSGVTSLRRVASGMATISSPSTTQARLVFTRTLAQSAPSGQSVSLLLAWDEGPEEDAILGYTLRYGTVSGSYPHAVNVGLVTMATLSGLTAGVVYFIVVVAYNAFGTSEPSNEVSGIGQ